jgi:hypothetical protein
MPGTNTARAARPDAALRRLEAELADLARILPVAAVPMAAVPLAAVRLVAANAPPPDAASIYDDARFDNMPV